MLQDRTISVNYRLCVLGETTYLGGKFDVFFILFFVFWVFFWRGIWDSRGAGVESPQKIAGINTELGI